MDTPKKKRKGSGGGWKSQVNYSGPAYTGSSRPSMGMSMGMHGSGDMVQTFVLSPNMSTLKGKRLTKEFLNKIADSLKD